MSKSSSEKVGQHSSLTINPNSSEQALKLGKKIEGDLHRKKQPLEYDFRAVEAYAIGKKAMVMVEEKGVDLQYFYAAILERQSEKTGGGEITGVGNFLRKNGVNPNVSNEIIDEWAEKTTPTAIYGIMSELENLGINRMDLFLTGFKDGRAQIVHLMDENRKENFKPLPAELVDRMRNALGKRRGGMDDTSFRRLEPIIERVRWDEKNFDVARTFPTFRVTVLKVDGGDAKGKIEAINRAVKKFNRENTLPYFELSPTNAHDLGDNLAVMPRTLAVSLQELEMGGSTYSNYINSVLKHNEIKREDVEAARKLLDEKFRIKYEGETYALDSDQFTFAQVSRGRLVMVPNIELGQKIE